jgi:GNAT superfamily N-acetyltransferase
MRAITNSPPDLAAFCAMHGPDDLSPQAVVAHAPDEKLLLDGAARCSLWWRNVPAYGDERVGLLGHYMAVDAAAALEVLSLAGARLRETGCTLAIGPIDGSTWRRYRLLTQRGDEPPFFLEPDNPDDWPAHWAGAGFEPIAHYYSALLDDLTPPAGLRAAELSAQGYSIQAIDPSRLEAGLQTIWAIAIDAFARNFLYTPISRQEFVDGYKKLLPVIEPRLVLVAEHGGRPVGFCFAVPDVLAARRGATRRTVIMKTLGIVRAHAGRGLGRLLFWRTLDAAAALGFQRAILALMHEANPSRRFGGPRARDFRRYTLYAKPL